MKVDGKKLDFDRSVGELFAWFVADRINAPQVKAKIAKYKGEVGIEIEVEGRHLPRAVKSYWQYVPDGSLRGHESAEYILKQPCGRRSVLPYLKYLAAQLKAKKAVIDDSPRTSVHVHVNMAKHSMVQVYNYMILYYIVEELMANIAGEARVGNLFCLRASDAEYVLDLLAAYAKARKFDPNPEQVRYTSINFCAITKFNSLEFRALRGTTDPLVIHQWVKLLLQIKDVALGYKYPTDILEDFSKLGARKFIEKIFPQDADLFLKQKGAEDAMWQGARLVQDIVYATAWNEPQKPKRLFDVGNEPDRGDD